MVINVPIFLYYILSLKYIYTHICTTEKKPYILDHSLDRLEAFRTRRKF